MSEKCWLIWHGMTSAQQAPVYHGGLLDLLLWGMLCGWELCEVKQGRWMIVSWRKLSALIWWKCSRQSDLPMRTIWTACYEHAMPARLPRAVPTALPGAVLTMLLTSSGPAAVPPLVVPCSTESAEPCLPPSASAASDLLNSASELPVLHCSAQLCHPLNRHQPSDFRK